MVLDTVFLADEEKHVLAVKFWGGILVRRGVTLLIEMESIHFFFI